MNTKRRLYTEAEIFRGSEAVSCGVLRRSDLHDPRYRRLFRDGYAAPGVRVTHELRCRALGLLAPRGPSSPDGPPRPSTGCNWHCRTIRSRRSSRPAARCAPADR